MKLVSDKRVVSGTVIRAYPLQSLRGDTSLSSTGSGTFGPGVGPCGQDAASQMMAVVVENHILFILIMAIAALI